MAIRMDTLAVRDDLPGLCAEWRAMAAFWRDLARQADWQDRYAVRCIPA